MELHAVRIFVHDWDAACRFYGETLGLRERFRSDPHGWAEYDVGGAALGIERVDAADAASSALVGRFVGVSLRVDDIVHRALAERGVRFTAPPERQAWGGTLAELADPDGNRLTLLG